MTKKNSDEIAINEVSNTYGTLLIKEYNNKYYWCMEDATELDKWHKIPKALFLELKKHNNEKHI